MAAPATAPRRSHPSRRPPGAAPPASRHSRSLARYELAGHGRREVVEIAGADASRLVVDRHAATGSDSRLVAHLWADEPHGNAELVCASYLESVGSAAGAGRLCRPLTDADLLTPPAIAVTEARPFALEVQEPLVTPDGRHAYRIEPVAGTLRIPELRWRSSCAGRAETVSLRAVIAGLEAYEPACGRTRRALHAHTSTVVSVTVLGLELARVERSAIVLNRGLREAVLATIAREALSMSEIAIRCGRVKRDASGNLSGETSWLARRLGLLAEGGQQAPTPWVHSDVLALIARRGLGVSPREVEL